MVHHDDAHRSQGDPKPEDPGEKPGPEELCRLEVKEVARFEEDSEQENRRANACGKKHRTPCVSESLRGWSKLTHGRVPCNATYASFEIAPSLTACFTEICKARM